MQKTKKLLTIGITAIVLLWTLAMMPAPASADIIINVPLNYPTIQAAINAAGSGDTVLVADGTYTGPGNKDLNFGGKAITVRSLNGAEWTIIDCQGSGSGFYFYSGETSSSVVDGFTITNGSAVYGGGGMFIFYSSPTVTNCIFTGNQAAFFGGGMYNEQSSPNVTNCIFTGNSADYDGGGMYNWKSSPTLTNCTFTGNLAHFDGGGMYNYQSSPTVTNCILWGDSAAEVDNDNSTPTFSYCDIAGSGGSTSWDSSFGGDGGYNIDADPLFVDPGYWDDNGNWVQGDYHLQYNPPEEVSPCIDAGTNDAPDLPGTDFDGNLRIINDIVDMGAFEYTGGPTNEQPVADANGPYEAITDGVLVDIDPDTLNLKSKGKWVTAYLIGDPDATVVVALDGSNSYDPDEDEITFKWTITNSDDTVTSDEVKPELSLGVGVYDVSLVVHDGEVSSEPSTSTIVVSLLDVSTVDPTAVYLNGVQGDWGDFQDPELMVKFDRSNLQDILEIGDEVEMTVSGQLYDGGPTFEGRDTIRVIDKGNNKEKNRGRGRR